MTRFDPGVRLFHFGGRRSQLKEFAPWMRSATTPDEAKDLATELADLVGDESLEARLLIVIEDVPQFADTPAERPLKALFQAVNRSEHLLIGDADVSQIASGFGLIGDFKGGRKGIVLRPDAFDGDAIFKVPFPKVKRSDFPEGRGIFVQSGRAVTVQMPLVEGVHAGGAADRGPAMTWGPAWGMVPIVVAGGVSLAWSHRPGVGRVSE